MRKVRARLPLVLALLVGTAACDDDGPARPAADAPPTAALTASFIDVVNEGYAYTAFAANPLGCRDDRTPRRDLQVRWDWEADGEWDSGFIPLEYMMGFVPSPLPSPGALWTVRCEVRDEAGHVVAAAASARLPAPWFTAPDLVARRANVDTLFAYAGTDTVRSGCVYHVMANHLRWTAEGTGGDMAIDVYVDGVRVQRTRQALAPNLSTFTDCEGNAQYVDCRLVAGDPGLHTITVVVDAEDGFAETDETNNTHTRTFVVVP